MGPIKSVALDVAGFPTVSVVFSHQNACVERCSRTAACECVFHTKTIRRYSISLPQNQVDWFPRLLRCHCQSDLLLQQGAGALCVLWMWSCVLWMWPCVLWILSYVLWWCGCVLWGVRRAGDGSGRATVVSIRKRSGAWPWNVVKLWDVWWNCQYLECHEIG